MALSDDEIAFIAAVERAATVAEVSACIDSYYDDFDNPVGGSLHIVLDDKNLSDDSLRFCIEFAETGFAAGSANGMRPDYQTDPDPLGAALGRKLLSMSLEDRAAAIG